jgi:hypothetical protein
MARRWCIMILAGALGGCASVTSAVTDLWDGPPAAAPADQHEEAADPSPHWAFPWGLLWPRHETAETGPDRVVITTASVSDARAQAADQCAKDQRSPRLTSAKPAAGAAGTEAEIIWQFDCVY